MLFYAPGVFAQSTDEASASDEEPVVTGTPQELLAGGQSDAGSAADIDLGLSTAPRVYLPEDFSRFAPRNALDMIEEIPGFQISGDGNDGSRGFGQASGNLLINGDRPSSKSTSTSDQLSRIPVDNVVRIEVVDGATLDIPGLSGRVANIIVKQGGMSGQFEWRPQFSTGPADPSPFEGALSITGNTGSVDYTFALDAGAFVRGSEGPAIFTDSAGFVDERRNLSTGQFNRPELSGTFRIQVAPEVVANVNLLGGITRFRGFERETRIPSNPLEPFSEEFRNTNDEWFYELGGDIEFPLGPGRLKLIVLESFEHGEFVSTALSDFGTGPTTGSRFSSVRDEGERIGRAEYSWGMLGADWQLSAEAAFNRLDRVGSLFGYDASDESFFSIPFPDGVGGVREDRYEALLSVGFPITGKLSLQLVAGGEYSSISQTGTNALSRTFQRPKGSLSLAWAAAEGLDINFEIERRVGQLNFTDFLASVDLSDENQNAGNNQLRPSQDWLMQLEVAKDFGRWGSATLALFNEEFEDLVLYVPVGGGAEARGNIDSANRYGLRLTGTLELEPLGMPGAKFDTTLTAEKSSLDDPVTGINRRFDFNNPFEIRINFRHDVPRTVWAWGVEFRDTEYAPGFRIDQFFIDRSPNTFGAVFVEHKDVLGATVRLRVGNVFDGETYLLRTVFDGPRDTGSLDFVEERSRKIGQVINLTVSGSF